MKQEKNVASTKETPQSENVKCPKCGQSLSTGAKFCNYCGAKIVPMKYCSECGSQIEETAKFCSFCGAKTM
jgi:predicted amidophosphoribosyltransferase